MVEEGKGGNICAIPIKSLVSAGRVLQKATANNNHNTGTDPREHAFNKYLHYLLKFSSS